VKSSLRHVRFSWYSALKASNHGLSSEHLIARNLRPAQSLSRATEKLMLQRLQLSFPSRIFLRSSRSLFAMLIVTAVAAAAGAQIQGSCQFLKFNRRFLLNDGRRFLNPEGIND
jgi:hypothetical protein